MSQFNLEQALAQNTRLHAERMRNGRQQNTYILYYAQDPRHIAGKMVGNTIKYLIDEFRKDKTQYSLAFIVKKGAEDVVMRSYNRANGKKFISHTRKGGKRKVK